jgi:hypothetical protein
MVVHSSTLEDGGGRRWGWVGIVGQLPIRADPDCSSAGVGGRSKRLDSIGGATAGLQTAAAVPSAQDAAMPRLFKTASSFTTPVYQQPGADSAQAQEQQHGNAPAALSGCPVLAQARPAAEAASSSSSRRKRGQQLYQGQHRQLYQGQHRQQQQAQQQL